MALEAALELKLDRIPRTGRSAEIIDLEFKCLVHDRVMIMHHNAGQRQPIERRENNASFIWRRPWIRGGGARLYVFYLRLLILSSRRNNPIVAPLIVRYELKGNAVRSDLSNGYFSAQQVEDIDLSARHRYGNELFLRPIGWVADFDATLTTNDSIFTD